jgi:hypothetical protein
MRANVFISACLTAGLAFCATSCWTPPGKGRKAESEYKAAAPVIAALDKFHTEHGHYPTNVSDLLPMYLPGSKALLVRGRVEPLSSPQSDGPRRQPRDSSLDSFRYWSGRDTYTLMFQYVGPGMNTCTYDSKTKRRTAVGYY